MARPNFISQKDLDSWDIQIAADPELPSDFGDDPIQKEVLYCGLWLYEQLFTLGADKETIEKLQYTAGSLSYNNDPWNVHQITVASYIKWKTAPSTQIKN